MWYKAISNCKECACDTTARRIIGIELESRVAGKEEKVAGRGPKKCYFVVFYFLVERARWIRRDGRAKQARAELM